MEKQGGKSSEKPKKYGIDAEIGRLEVPTYEIKKGSQKVSTCEIARPKSHFRQRVLTADRKESGYRGGATTACARHCDKDWSGSPSWLSHQ